MQPMSDEERLRLTLDAAASQSLKVRRIDDIGNGTSATIVSLRDDFFAPPDPRAECLMAAFVIGWTMFAGLCLLLATAAEMKALP